MTPRLSCQPQPYCTAAENAHILRREHELWPLESCCGIVFERALFGLSIRPAACLCLMPAVLDLSSVQCSLVQGRGFVEAGSQLVLQQLAQPAAAEQGVSKELRLVGVQVGCVLGKAGENITQIRKVGLLWCHTYLHWH